MAIGIMPLWFVFSTHVWSRTQPTLKSTFGRRWRAPRAIGCESAKGRSNGVLGAFHVMLNVGGGKEVTRSDFPSSIRLLILLHSWVFGPYFWRQPPFKSSFPGDRRRHLRRLNRIGATVAAV